MIPAEQNVDGLHGYENACRFVRHTEPDLTFKCVLVGLARRSDHKRSVVD